MHPVGPGINNLRSSRHITRATTSTLLNHLKQCEYQTPEVQQQAKAASEKIPVDQLRTPMKHQSSLVPSHAIGMSCSCSASSSLQQPPSNDHFYQSHTVTGISDPTGCCPPEHLVDDAISNISGHSLAPSDSLSRVASRAPSRPSVGEYSTWTADLQNRFEELLVHITASAGLPLSWVDNLEFEEFVLQFIPHARPVS